MTKEMLNRRNTLTLLAGIPLGKMLPSTDASSGGTRSSGSTGGWPMFQYNPANTGSIPDTAGPKQHGQELFVLFIMKLINAATDASAVIYEKVYTLTADVKRDT